MRQKSKVMTTGQTPTNRWNDMDPSGCEIPSGGTMILGGIFLRERHYQSINSHNERRESTDMTKQTSLHEIRTGIYIKASETRSGDMIPSDSQNSVTRLRNK